MIPVLTCWILLVFAFAFPASTDAGIVSERIFFMAEDGLHCLYYVRVQSEMTSRGLLFKKEGNRNPEEYLSRFEYIYPNTYQWDTTKKEFYDRLEFPQGSYAVLSREDLSGKITEDKDGIYTFDTQDLKSEKQSNDGKYGFFTTSGNFSEFICAWVFPQQFEILEYKSNRAGEWKKRRNTVSWYGKDVNSLVFTIRFRMNGPRIQKSSGIPAEKIPENSAPESGTKSIGISSEKPPAISKKEPVPASSGTISEKNPEISEKKSATASSGTPSDKSPMVAGTEPVGESFAKLLEGHDYIHLEKKDKCFIILFDPAALFPSGKVTLSSIGKSVLTKIAETLSGKKMYQVIVEGHTDNRPVNKSDKGKFFTNWEISAARSLSVLRYLVMKGVPESSLEVRAYGSQRPRASNDTPEGRAINRRIELCVCEAPESQNGNF